MITVAELPEFIRSEGMPLYLLTLFAKNERANISKSQRNELADLTTLLVRAWATRSTGP